MNGIAQFDVVVVGARCAGAALATFLARSGARVLLIDRDPLPSDQILSTHTIHPPGVDVLDQLGVGEAVRSVTPKSPRMRLRKGDASVDLTFADGRHELCPRRERLDGLLQDAAVAAGAELRDSTRATRVLFEANRAVGVEVGHGSATEQIRAELIIGADGRRSFVAAEARAEEYMAYDAPRAMYWGYWDAPPMWQTEQFPFDMYLGQVQLDTRVIFQTDHNQLLIGSLPGIEAAQAWRKDPLAALKENLAGDTATAPLVADRDPRGSVRGTIRERYFFRQGAGPGWALVGDAGHHKEFVVGDGITEALLQAKSLAAAVALGSDEALVRWWRERDVEALPGYFWGQDEGGLISPPQLQSLVVNKIARDERLQRLMTRLPEHQCSPYDALPVTAILPVLFGAVAKGRFGVIPEFLAQGRRVGEYKRSLRERIHLLEEARRLEQTARAG